MVQNTTKPWDSFLTDDERRGAVDAVITFFAEERDEEIGRVAATELLDMFLEMLGGRIFNTGLESGKEWFKKALSEIEVDYGMLQR